MHILVSWCYSPLTSEYPSHADTGCWFAKCIELEFINLGGDLSSLSFCIKKNNLVGGRGITIKCYVHLFMLM